MLVGVDSASTDRGRERPPRRRASATGTTRHQARLRTRWHIQKAHDTSPRHRNLRRSCHQNCGVPLVNVSSLAPSPIKSVSQSVRQPSVTKLATPSPKKVPVTKFETPSREKARSQNSRPHPEKKPRLQNSRPHPEKRLGHKTMPKKVTVVSISVKILTFGRFPFQ